MTELQTNILQDITNEICKQAEIVGSEERYPHGNVDQMDDIIRDVRRNVEVLRRVRTELEHLFTGMLV